MRSLSNLLLYYQSSYAHKTLLVSATQDSCYSKLAHAILIEARVSTVQGHRGSADPSICKGLNQAKPPRICFGWISRSEKTRRSSDQGPSTTSFCFLSASSELLPDPFSSVRVFCCVFLADETQNAEGLFLQIHVISPHLSAASFLTASFFLLPFFLRLLQLQP
jgi:hypothetical protein